MAAFASNAMLLAQFSTPDVREGLRESIRLKALADIEDPKITVLVVREVSSDPHSSDTAREDDNDDDDDAIHQNEAARVGTVIAFAKWSHPVGKDEGYEEAPWRWPPGTNMVVLEAWGRVTEEIQEQAMGSQPCYRLTFMGTDPRYERRGAASMMVHWGLERCRKNGVSGYLESTSGAAPFYEKMGFIPFKKIYLRYAVVGQDQYDTYEEMAFKYNPASV